MAVDRLIDPPGNGRELAADKAKIEQEPPLLSMERQGLLIRGFNQVREGLNSQLVNLAEENLRLRTQEIPQLPKIIANEAQLRVQAGEIQAVDYFIGQLNELAEAGIQMPDISVLVQLTKPIELTPANVPVVVETPSPQLLPAKLKPEVNNLQYDDYSPVIGISAEVPELSVLLQAKQPNLRDPEVMALTERAQSGDKSAFEGIYARYLGPIYRRLLRMLGNPEQAMDLAQEVFVKAQEKIGLTRAGTTIGPWLYRIANNLAVDQMRSRSKKPTDYFVDGYDVEDKSSSTGVGSINNLELTTDLTKVLARLTPEQRAVLDCRYLKGMDILQTAEAVGITEAGVKKLQARGLATCRRLMAVPSFLT